MVWHIVNVLVSAGVGAVSLIINRRIVIQYKTGLDTYCEQLTFSEIMLGYDKANSFFMAFDLYFDIFLLWLLFRFTSPLHTHSLPSPSLEQSHYLDDSESNIQAQIDLLSEEKEEKKRISHRQEFLEYAIREMSQNIETEAAIANEFVDPSQRDSFSSLTGYLQESTK